MDPFSIAAAFTAALEAAAAAAPGAAATTAATTAGAAGSAAAAGATAGAAAAGGGLTAAGLGAGTTLASITAPAASMFAPGFAGLNSGLGTFGGAGLSATGAVPSSLAIGGGSGGSGFGALAGLGTSGASLTVNPGASTPVVPGTGLKSNVGQVGGQAKQSLMKQITEGAKTYSPFIKTGLGMLGGSPDSPKMGGVPFQGFQPMQRPKGTPIQLGGNAAQFSVAPYQPGNRNIITPQFGR